MTEEQVDEVEPEPLERTVDRLHQVLAIQRVLHVGEVVQTPEDLRRDHVRVTRPAELGDRGAHDPFRLALGVRLGIVEEVDAGFVRGLQTVGRLGDPDLLTERHPRSERQHTDLQPRRPEPSGIACSSICAWLAHAPLAPCSCDMYWLRSK